MDEPVSFGQKLRHILIGKPRQLAESSILHKLALVPVLAWIGLGADGLSSSSYGPEEAYRTLGEHVYLAVLLVGLMALTIFVISACYSKIIEEFPHGGGGYVVASKLLGPRVGVVSGSALLVDYVLTVTVSIAAAGDALFSFMPPSWQPLKLGVEIFFILALIILNLRGVKESVLVLAPIFIVFVITHLITIFGGIIGHYNEFAETTKFVQTGFSQGSQTLGWSALLLLLVHAYSLGGGTYTGIEAVSNGLPIMREPRVQTAKRTMVYMAASLAFTASGLLLCYLLWRVAPAEGKTLNAVLLERMTDGITWGPMFVIVTLISEGLLLVVAAQTGFIDGPRVLANMAVDSWIPRRFAALSDRLTTGNGILLMGFAALAALLYSHGSVSLLVVMYSINVFLTFSLSIFGMLKHYLTTNDRKVGIATIALFLVGFVFCATILCITVIEKFASGGWLTLVMTGGLVATCLMVKSHYTKVAQMLGRLNVDMSSLSAARRATGTIDLGAKTAVIMVGGFGNLGLQTVKNILRTFPGVYQNIVFASVAVIDSGVFKGENTIDDLKHATEENLKKYVAVVEKMGFHSAYRLAVGTEIVEAGCSLCEQIAAEFADPTFFTGKLIFERDNMIHLFLHNETAISLQKRMQWAGLTMVMLPVKIA